MCTVNGKFLFKHRKLCFIKAMNGSVGASTDKLNLLRN